MQIYPKGTRILCSECGEELYSLLKEVKPGDPVKAENLQPLGKQRVAVPGELALCDYCGSAFIFTKFKVPLNTH
jgi:DNA-directed RNA polymerase subunit RPC12/RpoP